MNIDVPLVGAYMLLTAYAVLEIIRYRRKRNSQHYRRREDTMTDEFGNGPREIRMVAIAAHARGDYEAERLALDRLALMERECQCWVGHGGCGGCSGVIGITHEPACGWEWNPDCPVHLT